jgi:hypothetical protein
LPVCGDWSVTLPSGRTLPTSLEAASFSPTAWLLSQTVVLPSLRRTIPPYVTTSGDGGAGGSSFSVARAVRARLLRAVSSELR